MATPFNWSAITNGDVFQSLVNTLVLFEEPTARTFIRPGKDGAQDARSADGKRVWQAKHHQSPAIGKAISDALRELEKIKEYRKPSDPNYELWKDVSEWTLITNVEMNAASDLRWTNEVVSKFKQASLEAKLWSKEKIEALLTKFPHVAAAYFEGRNRCFLSLREAFDQSESDAIGSKGLKIALEGRQEESRKIVDFLIGTKKLICVHGPGGIGKSRFLLEIGRTANRQGFEVVWGQEATLSSSTDWFSAITPERPTLLLLDEPKDPRLLDMISEQLSPAGRMKSWKVVVSVRSPKDPVLKAVNEMSETLREQSIELAPLSKSDGEFVAMSLIEAGDLRRLTKEEKEQASAVLASAANRYPVWIVIAVSVLEKDNTLAQFPTTSAGLAARYVQEVIEFSPSQLAEKKQINTLIHWLAAYEEVNVENTAVLSFMARETGLLTEASVHECLNSLVNRKFVIRRGVGGRLYSVRPDVVREFVIRDWLTQQTETGYEVTPAAKRLIDLLFPKAGETTIPNAQQLLKSVALLEFSERLQGHQVDLLSPLFRRITDAAIEGTLLDQQRALGYLQHIAFTRITEALGLIDVIKKTPRDDVEVKNPLFGKTELTHDKLIAGLPWLVFDLAHYAFTEEERLTTLRELIELFLREFGSTDKQWNDGKRARDLIPRVIRGEVNFRSSFWEDGFNEALTRIQKLKGSKDATDAEIALVDVLSDPFLSLERERTHFARTKFVVQRWLVPARPNKERDQLRNAIRDLLLDSGTLRSVRLAAWRLLADAHSSANRTVIAGKGDELKTYVAQVREDLAADLRWTLEFLEHSQPEIWELKAAREIWDWHHRFESDPSLKALADKCERLYQSHPLAAAFHVLFSHEHYKEGSAKAIEVGGKLGISGTSHEIAEFLSDAEQFASPNAAWPNLSTIADEIGKHWNENPEIETFTKTALAQDVHSLAFKFAAVILAAKLRNLRGAGNEEQITEFLRTWMAIPPDRAGRDELLFLLYVRPHPLLTGVLRKPDLNAMLSMFGLYNGGNGGSSIAAATKLRLIVGAHHVDPDLFRRVAEKIWYSLRTEERAEGLAVLIDSMTFLDAFRSDYPQLTLTAAHYDWFLSFLILLPDMEELNGHPEWELSELTIRFGKKPVQWLVEAIETRLKSPAEHQEEDSIQFKPVPIGDTLLRYVKSIDAADAESPEAVGAITSLLAYNDRPDSLGYVLPQYAVAVDPDGHIVPDAVVARLKRLTSRPKDEIWRWSRFAGHYAFNSDPWRKIAIAALAASQGLSLRDRTSLYVSLLEQGFKSSSFAADEMDPQFADELQRRREERANETDPNLIPFRDWALRVAE